jgi:hypothetical protein
MNIGAEHTFWSVCGISSGLIVAGRNLVMQVQFVSREERDTQRQHDELDGTVVIMSAESTRDVGNSVDSLTSLRDCIRTGACSLCFDLFVSRPTLAMDCMARNAREVTSRSARVAHVA